jgi:hypothetical protein
VEVKKPPLDAQQKSAMDYAERQVAAQLALLHSMDPEKRGSVID